MAGGVPELQALALVWEPPTSRLSGGSAGSGNPTNSPRNQGRSRNLPDSQTHQTARNRTQSTVESTVSALAGDGRLSLPEDTNLPCASGCIVPQDVRVAVRGSDFEVLVVFARPAVQNLSYLVFDPALAETDGYELRSPQAVLDLHLISPLEP